MAAETPGPGIYYGVSDEEYDGWDAVRSSTLSYFCDGLTPAHAYHSMYVEEKNSEALTFGSAFHIALLQPDQVEQLVVREIPGPFRSNAAKEERAEFRKAHSGRIILPHDEWDQLLHMRDACYRYKLPRQLLTAPGRSEVAILWDDGEWGIRCKVKIDRCIQEWRGYFTLLDLKTIGRHATRENVTRAIGDFGYQRQEAMYRRGVEVHTGPVAMPYLLLFVPKVAPYIPAVYQMEYEDLEQGRHEIAEAVEKYKKATSTGAWPGHGMEPMSVSLPAWKRRRGDEL